MSFSETIGDYVIIDRIAVGGMAEIFLGKRLGPEKFEKAVVIKRLLPDLAGDEKFTAMFLDEARLAARLSHANIVQIYDLGRDGDSFYIAMEYLIGEDLSAVIVEHVNAGRRMVPTVAARIVAQAAEGLHYAHALTGSDGEPLHIVHRDISPSNIVITHQGHVKVVDFGIAKAADRVVRTETGVVKGKLAYMSPEQLQGGEVDGRTDIYALGVTLFEAVSCTRMFPEMQPMSVYGAIKRGELPALGDRVPDLSRDLERIVGRCLAYDPSVRYPTALELQHDLERYVATGERMPTAHDLAEMLNQCFGAEYFEKMSRRTQQRLASVVMPPESLSAEDTVREANDDTLITGGDAEVTADLPTITDRVVPPTEETVIDGAADRPGLRRWWPAGVLLAGLLVGLGTWMGMRPVDVVESGAPPAAVLPAEPALGILRLASTPAGARAYLDGRPLAGETPMTIAALDPAREHTLLVERDQYASVLEKFEVMAGEVVELTVVLDPLVAPAEVLETPVPSAPRKDKTKRPKARVGYLTLQSNVSLRVRAGKRDLGVTPVVRAELPPGRANLTLSNSEEGINRRLRVNIRAGATVEEQFALGKGKMSIDVEPWADIYLGKKKLGTTPLLDHAMWEGEYVLTLDNPQVAVKKSVRVTIRPGKTTRVRTRLD